MPVDRLARSQPESRRRGTRHAGAQGRVADEVDLFDANRDRPRLAFRSGMYAAGRPWRRVS